jgi:hypothetical protein
MLPLFLIPQLVPLLLVNNSPLVVDIGSMVLFAQFLTCSIAIDHLHTLKIVK